MKNFLQNSYLKKVGSFTNSLMIKGKLRHPKVKSYDFKSAYKAHDYIENSKKIGKFYIGIKTKIHSLFGVPSLNH